jgi:hypothetical protein
MKASKRLLFLALGVILVTGLIGLVGCAPYPHVGYYELDEAIAHAKTSEESRYYKAKLDQFNSDADAAVLFYERRSRCNKNRAVDRFGERTMWLCQSHNSRPRDPDRRPFKDIVDQVNAYRRDKWACGCASRREVMSGLFEHNRRF